MKENEWRKKKRKGRRIIRIMERKNKKKKIEFFI
jgi:hypothetical protein